MSNKKILNWLFYQCTKDKALHFIGRDWYVWFPRERTKAEFVWNVSVTLLPSHYQSVCEGNRFDISEDSFIVWYREFISPALLTDEINSTGFTVKSLYNSL